MRPSARVTVVVAAVLLLVIVAPFGLTRAATIVAPTADHADAIVGATSEDAPSALPGTAPGTAPGAALDPAIAERLGPALSAVAASGGDELVLVQLITTDEPDLGSLVSSWRPTTVRFAGWRTVAALVRADRLAKLATHRDVVAVLPAGEPLTTGFSDRSPTGDAAGAAPGDTAAAPGDTASTTASAGAAAPGNTAAAAAAAASSTASTTPPGASVTGAGAPRDAQTDLWYSRKLFGVDRAEANGYDGTGVIVGIEDSGADFGHPELRGTFARVNDPSSPYHGFPLVYDDASASRYVTQGGRPAGTNYADSSRAFTPQVPRGREDSAELLVPVSRREVVSGEERTSTITVTRAITYINTSRSGRIHYGLHPDSTLQRTEVSVLDGQLITETVRAVFLVVDEGTSGKYDSVYVDLGTQAGSGPLSATYDFRTAIAARLGPTEDPTVSKDLNDDGLADLSGGIVYFIADGQRHVPILDWLWDADGHVDRAKRIPFPAAGELVAFYGDFSGNSHGTGVATQIVGQGRISSPLGNGIAVPPTAGGTEIDRIVGGVTPGYARGAKVFATRPLGVPNQWIAMTHGYDGIVGTGDEAQVINNSWGSTTLPTSLQNVQDALSTALNEEAIAPRTLFVVSAGNGGQGYSTISSPSSGSTVFAVGAGGQYGTDDLTSVISNTVQIADRDPAAFSSRGPDLMGRAGVAIMAIGDSSSGGTPLNIARDRSGRYNGDFAWVRFGGTSQAGPQAVGVAALVIQAFKDRNGVFPTHAETRALMQFGADDTDHDPALQGAGHVNADQSTAGAGGLFGATVSAAEWQVGDYRGQHYPDFPNIARRGATYRQAFTFTNPSDVAVTLDLASDHLEAIGRRDFEVKTNFAEEDPYQYKRPDYLAPLPVLPGTEMIQVRLAQPWETFCIEDAASPHLGCGFRGTSAWYLRAYAWHDWNRNGRVWDDANANGVVNVDELDLPSTPTGASEPDPRTSLELSSLGESNISGNSQDLRIRRPLDRGAEGLYLALIHRARSDQVPQETLRFQVTYYRHRPWVMLELDRSELELAPGATAVVNATVLVPNDAAYGYHQGSLRVTSTIGDPDRAETAGLRVLHALPGLPAVDFYVDGTRVLSRLDYGTISGPTYLDVAPGVHFVQAVIAGVPPILSFVSGYVTVRAGVEQTAVLSNIFGEMQIQIIADSNARPAPGGSRLRFSNFTLDLGTVDVYIDGQLAYTGVRHRDVTRPVKISNGRHIVTVTPTGESRQVLTTGPVDFTDDNVTIHAYGDVALARLATLIVHRVDRGRYPQHVSALPVVVNVAATADLWQPLVLGGLPPADTPFDIGRVHGLYDWRGNGTARQGDWRNFFVDVPDTMPASETLRFLVRATWPITPTDIDLLAFTPMARPRAIVDGTETDVIQPGGRNYPVDPAVSGPYDLALTARTQDTSHSVGGTAYSFNTVTGGPEEWLAGPLGPGLHLFAHHNVLYDGRDPAGSPFTTTVAAAEVTPARLTRLAKTVTGTFEIALRTGMDLPGIEVRAYGLQPLGIFTDSVATGGLHAPASTRYYTVTTASSGLIEVKLVPNGIWPNYDLDLYLQRQADDESWSDVATSAGPDATESLRLLAPADGVYRAVVHGFEVPAGATYTLMLLNAEGNELTVTNVTTEPVPAGSTTRFNVSYLLTYTEGSRDGVVFIGPTGAPLVFEVPVRIAWPSSSIELPFLVRRW